jgi:hypothetical protein
MFYTSTIFFRLDAKESHSDFFVQPSMCAAVQKSIAILTTTSLTGHISAGIIRAKFVILVIPLYPNRFLYRPKIDSIISEEHNKASPRHVICYRLFSRCLISSDILN